jgi:hypothetical protein
MATSPGAPTVPCIHSPQPSASMKNFGPT